MTDLDDELAPATRLSAGAFYAKVAAGASDLSDTLEVIIPGFDTQLRFQEVYWQSRDDVSMPARGDECLVIFDDRRRPWVVAWWPYS